MMYERLSSAFDVCPTGATDNGDRQGCLQMQDADLCQCLRPSGAISMVPEKYPLLKKDKRQQNTKPGFRPVR